MNQAKKLKLTFPSQGWKQILTARKGMLDVFDFARTLEWVTQFCLLGLLFCAFLASCGGYDSSCAITAAVTPSSGTADHSAIAPGNQVQFSIKSTATGNCPLVADKVGTWSTSDPANTTISNSAPNQGLGICINATSSPATITNDGSFRGHAITPATLACN